MWVILLSLMRPLMRFKLILCLKQQKKPPYRNLSSRNTQRYRTITTVICTHYPCALGYSSSLEGWCSRCLSEAEFVYIKNTGKTSQREIIHLFKENLFRKNGCGHFRWVAHGVSGVSKSKTVPGSELGCFGWRTETGKEYKRMSFRFPPLWASFWFKLKTATIELLMRDCSNVSLGGTRQVLLPTLLWIPFIISNSTDIQKFNYETSILCAYFCQWVQKLSVSDKTQINTLIVPSRSSRNKNKNGKKISVNIN